MAPKKPVKKSAKPAAKAPAKAVKKVAKPVAKKASVKTLKKAVKPVAKPLPKKVVAKVSSKKTAKISKVAPKKATPKKTLPKKVAKPAKKVVAKVAAKAAPSKTSSKTPSKGSKSKAPEPNRRGGNTFITKPKVNKNLKLTPFLTKQRQRLLELKDTLLDAMRGVARDNLHAGSETSAFGMHQADAGSDAYDRDFALSMLSKEQGSLYEIDEALKRIEDGTYGVCEICEKPIKHERLEALPFTRTTVECQADLEKRQHHHSARPQITSLFGLTEEEAENEEEETTEAS